MTDGIETEGPEAPDGEAEAGGIDDIPVTLTFVMGQARLTVAQLRELSVGGLVPMEAEAPPGARLQVLANGRAFAEGVSVEVDGRPALRLTRLPAG